MFWRHSCTSRPSGSFSVEEWAALNAGLHSSHSVTRSVLVTGSAVVGALGLLLWAHTTSLQHQLEDKIDQSYAHLQTKVVDRMGIFEDKVDKKFEDKKEMLEGKMEKLKAEMKSDAMAAKADIMNKLMEMQQSAAGLKRGWFGL